MCHPNRKARGNTRNHGNRNLHCVCTIFVHLEAYYSTKANCSFRRSRLRGSCSPIKSAAFPDGWLAIGDAAQAYDPLSGQGPTKAITSALHAAALIASESRNDRAAFPEFAAARRHEFEVYLAAQRSHYRREQRWPQHMFWQRRGAAAPPESS
jgi:2-polyprenyl-6-methoxyphenol hydroxylase-like FAD-dependent oxidoreductase